MTRAISRNRCEIPLRRDEAYEAALSARRAAFVTVKRDSRRGVRRRQRRWLLFSPVFRRPAVFLARVARPTWQQINVSVSGIRPSTYTLAAEGRALSVSRLKSYTREGVRSAVGGSADEEEREEVMDETER